MSSQHLISSQYSISTPLATRRELFNHCIGPSLSDLVEQELQLTTATALLDAGCGYGTDLHNFSTRYPQLNLVGIDQSAAMIQRAQAETPLASFQVADITNLNLAERFDRILVKHVLHLTPKPIVALQHIIHHAQPNAIIVISVHSLKNQPKYTRWLDWFKQQTGLDYIPPSKKLSIENDEALFTSLGYNLSFTEVNERIHLTNPEPYLDYINSQKRWSRELTEAEKHLLLRYVRQEIESEIATQGYFEDWSINGVITLKLS